MTRRERFIKKLVAWAVALLYRRVEVTQVPGLTAGGPVLANASHFGGFTDPLLLIYAMDRVPRFIARDVIWRYPIVRSVMRWIRAIPIHKSDDGGPTSNDQMFRSTYEALGEGDLITIFPEGVTVDDPRIANIKTGSARIALGARASGVGGITLLSAGIHYGDKAALRSEVFIDIGYPIDLDDSIGAYVAHGEAEDASNRDAVAALTQEMEKRLRWAAPDFEDWRTARSLSAAAGVAIRPADGSDPDVGHGDRQRLARLLDGAPDHRKKTIAEAMDRYRSELDALGYEDEMFVSGLGSKRAFLWNAVKDLIIGLILVPFAIVGAIVNAIPLAIVWLIGRSKVADAMMATIKPIGAIFAFLVTWSLWTWLGWRLGGVELAAATVLLSPFYLFALIALAERLSLLMGALGGLTRSRSIRDAYEQVHGDRAAVVEAVVQAL